MQVDELLKPFPIKEFHPFPRAMPGPGAHEMIGAEALKIGFRKTLVMTSGLRGTGIVHKIVESTRPGNSATGRVPGPLRPRLSPHISLKYLARPYGELPRKLGTLPHSLN